MEPKAFQKATIAAAVKALTTGSRRFLLADEVGLGKTVVAKEVVRHLAKKIRGRPLRVFYFASAQTVAAQNAPRLFPEDDKEKSLYKLIDASRPSLLPMAYSPKDGGFRVQLFRFTPDTALPALKGRGRGGVALERALLRVLLARSLRWKVPRNAALRDAFIGGATTGFVKAVRSARARYNSRQLLSGHRFTETFRETVRAQFNVSEGEHLPSKVHPELEPRTFVARLRIALASATIQCMPPDIIIFDEFHRYRDKAFPLPTSDAGNQAGHSKNFLSVLPKGCRPAILLLSATPFQAPTTKKRRENASDADDFHQLVGFLHGDGPTGEAAYRSCRELFDAFERELSSKAPDASRLFLLRQQLESKWLRPRIARMERAAFDNETNPPKRLTETADLPSKADLDVFVKFANGLDPDDRASAVAYWLSVPLPHQALGITYRARREANKKAWRGIPSITKSDRETITLQDDLPHTKLRNLLREFPPERLALPWLPPSYPWWPLQGAWQTASKSPSIEKGLLFSRYRAVPPAVAGLVSFAVENWAAKRRGWSSYKRINQQSFLAPKSLNVVALFHPSAWLADRVNPAAMAEKSAKGLLREAMRALRAALPDENFDSKSLSRRPVWKVLGMLELTSNVLPMDEVWQTADRGAQVERALAHIQKTAVTAIPRISAHELRELAWFALTAPGVVLLRSLKRHWSGAVGADGLKSITELSWNGLRPYLDQPWFVARLTNPKKQRSYPEALQIAVLEGNLEAVLDEHFWMPNSDSSSWLPSYDKRVQRGRIADLRHSLGIRSAPVTLLSPVSDSAKSRVRLAAHAALPLTDTVEKTNDGAGQKQLRADDLRRAFNTPFWPHLLCTTSVGQEGLDFHVWCRTVVHWDLCANPIDLEQREGRVNRFKCLAVRRALADRVASKSLHGLWNELEFAAENFGDDSGLAPWWIFEGAAIRRIFLDAPSSEERSRRKQLEHLRDLYRLVLGLPHQADVLQRLAAGNINPVTIRSLCLDLGALRRPSVTRPQP